MTPMLTTAEPTKTDNQPRAAETSLAVALVVDRSGSMQIVKDDTIGAFNQYIDTLAREAPSSRLALTMFDSQGIDVEKAKPITEVARLTTESYQPRASTPLYDAIGKAVTELDGVDASRKALVILTDGQENASREWTKDAVKKLIDEREAADWLIIYLGANQDAFVEGGKVGTQTANTMSFDAQNMNETMIASANATMRYATAPDAKAGKLRSAFTSSERERAAKKGDNAPKS